MLAHSMIPWHFRDDIYVYNCLGVTVLTDKQANIIRTNTQTDTAENNITLAAWNGNYFENNLNLYVNKTEQPNKRGWLFFPNVPLSGHVRGTITSHGGGLQRLDISWAAASITGNDNTLTTLTCRPLTLTRAVPV